MVSGLTKVSHFNNSRKKKKQINRGQSCFSISQLIENVVLISVGNSQSFRQLKNVVCEIMKEFNRKSHAFTRFERARTRISVFKFSGNCAACDVSFSSVLKKRVSTTHSSPWNYFNTLGCRALDYSLV